MSWVNCLVVKTSGKRSALNDLSKRAALDDLWQVISVNDVSLDLVELLQRPEVNRVVANDTILIALW